MAVCKIRQYLTRLTSQVRSNQKKGPENLVRTTSIRIVIVLSGLCAIVIGVPGIKGGTAHQYQQYLYGPWDQQDLHCWITDLCDIVIVTAEQYYHVQIWSYFWSLYYSINHWNDLDKSEWYARLSKIMIIIKATNLLGFWRHFPYSQYSHP